MRDIIKSAISDALNQAAEENREVHVSTDGLDLYHDGSGQRGCYMATYYKGGAVNGCWVVRRRCSFQNDTDNYGAENAILCTITLPKQGDFEFKVNGNGIYIMINNLRVIIRDAVYKERYKEHCKAVIKPVPKDYKGGNP